LLHAQLCMRRNKYYICYQAHAAENQTAAAAPRNEMAIICKQRSASPS